MTVINPPPKMVESQRRFFTQHPDATFCDWMTSLGLATKEYAEKERCDQCGLEFLITDEVLRYKHKRWLCPTCLVSNEEGR